MEKSGESAALAREELAVPYEREGFKRVITMSHQARKLLRIRYLHCVRTVQAWSARSPLMRPPHPVV